MDLSPNPHDINLGIEFLIIEVRNKKGNKYLFSIIMMVDLNCRGQWKAEKKSLLCPTR